MDTDAHEWESDLANVLLAASRVVGRPILALPPFRLAFQAAHCSTRNVSICALSAAPATARVFSRISK